MSSTGTAISAARRLRLALRPLGFARGLGRRLDPLDLDLAGFLGAEHALSEELLDDLLVAPLVLVGESVVLAVVLDDDVLLPRLEVHAEADRDVAQRGPRRLTTL